MRWEGAYCRVRGPRRLAAALVPWPVHFIPLAVFLVPTAASPVLEWGSQAPGPPEIPHTDHKRWFAVLVASGVESSRSEA